MKKLFYQILFALTVCGIQESQAQIGVGTEMPQAALDIMSANKGFLVPRIALTSTIVAAPVTNPQGGSLVNGTLVYNTATAGALPNDVAPGFYYWKDTAWVPVGFTLPYNGTTAIEGSGGIFITNTETGGYGLFGKATGENYGIGVLGRSESPNGTGVRGLSTATTGMTYGVSGSASSPDGVGGIFSNILSGLALKTNSGGVQFGALAGSNTRMVITDALGNLSTQSIPSGGITYSAGSGINITDGTISAVDASSTNELQSLVLNGNQLSITGIQANPITLPSGELTLPYSGSGFNNNGNALFKIIHTGSVAAIEGVNNDGQAITATTQNGTALRAVATHGGGGLWSQTNTGDAGFFFSTAGNGIVALSATTGTAGSFSAPSGTALFAEGAVKLKTTGAAAGKYLMATDTNGTAEWVNAPGGGGGDGNWTLDGNNISNDNSGAVLIGTTTTTTSGIMEVTKNSPNGRVASFYNSGAAYMSVLNATENGMSGNPAGCDVCVGSKAINAVSTYGDALFARSTTGRGIYLKGGNSASYPAMLIETNSGATTALEMTAAIKITDGTQGAGKVLTSDANGKASWQTLSGGGGGGTLDASYDFGGLGAGRTITADAGAVKITGTDGLLITGSHLSGTNLEATGSGTKMFFYPKKSAFRTGAVSFTQWDDNNIGEYSVAAGYDVTAYGIHSVAMGNTSTAAGHSSVAIGNHASADGASALALGYSTNALGNISTSMGYTTSAHSFAETVIGAFNTNYTPASTSNWNVSDRLFVIGNGTDHFSRGDALMVHKNGNLTISGNAFKPGGGSWSATSDARLKTSVKNFSDGLNEVLEIHPVKYHYNEKSGNDTSKEHIGVIAQELQKVAPYMVSAFQKDGTEYLQVDNSAMTYMLINAIKEQQKTIEQQYKSIEELQKANSTLKVSIDQQVQVTSQLQRDMKKLKHFLMPSKTTANNGN